MTDERYLQKNKGYPIPETIDPVGTRCIRVYVPDHPLYLGEFWEAYSYFTRWIAWEKDGTDKAKQAAAAWLSRWNQARDEYEAQETGCEMITDLKFRPKPDAPCAMQFSTDNGETWEDAFDIADCIPTIPDHPPATFFRPHPTLPCVMEYSLDNQETWFTAFNLTDCIPSAPEIPPQVKMRPKSGSPCVMEVSYDNGANWEDAFDISECLAPPQPEPPDYGEDTQCVAASNVMQFFCEICNMAIYQFSQDNFNYTAITAEIVQYINSIAGGYTPSATAVNRMVIALSDFNDPTQFDEIGTWSDFYDYLLPEVDANGTLHSDWEDGFNDFLIAQPMDIWFAAAALLKALYPFWNAIASVGDNYCQFTAGASWLHTFDFTTGTAQGWFDDDTDTAVLNGAEGWEANTNTLGNGDKSRRIRLYRNVERFHITRLLIRYDFVYGDYPSPSEIFYVFEGIEWSGTPQGTRLIQEGSNQIEDITSWTFLDPDFIGNGLSIDLVAYGGAPYLVGGELDLEIITIYGRGFNPFRAEG